MRKLFLNALLFLGPVLSESLEGDVSKGPVLKETSVEAPRPPPIVLVSTSYRDNSFGTVEVTMEWNEDVMSHKELGNNFALEDIDMYNEEGPVYFATFGPADVLTSEPNGGFYGEAVARVPALSSLQSHRFIGTFKASTSGWVDVFVKGRAVCSPITQLCNSPSNVVRINMVPESMPTVTVSSSQSYETSKLLIPLTFQFSSEVNQVNIEDVFIYAYNLGYESPEFVTSTNVVPHASEDNTFVANVNVPSGLLDHLEIFLRSSKSPATFRESNHLRLSLLKPLDLVFKHLKTNDDEGDIPEVRQFTGSFRTSRGPVTSLPSLNTGVGLGGFYSAGRRVGGLPSAVMAGSSFQGLVETRNIIDEAVTHDKLHLNSVQNPNIVDSQVTTIKIHKSAVDNVAIGYGAVTEAKLADGAVTTGTLGLYSVTRDKLGSVSFGTDELQSGAGSMIGLEAVTTEKLFDHAVSSSRLAAKTVQNQDLADDSVTSKKAGNGSFTRYDSQTYLEDGVVTSDKIAVDGIDNGNGIEQVVGTYLKFATGSVAAEHLHRDAVSAMKLANSAFTGSDLGPGAIVTSKIIDSAVTTNKLHNSAVTDNKIADGILASSAIAADSIPISKVDPRLVALILDREIVTTDKLGDGLIGPYSIGEDAVTTIKIADGAVTVSDLDNDAVTKNKLNIIANSLDTAKFVDDSVTSYNLANGVIDSSRLSMGAVTTLKLSASGVDTENIDTYVVTAAKLGESAVATFNLADASITGSNLRDGAVTSNMLDGFALNRKIGLAAVTGDKIAQGSITTKTITDGAITSKGLSGITFNKIVDGSITTASLADGSIPSNAFHSNSVLNNNIADQSVFGGDIKTGAVQNAHFGVITSQKIANGAVTLGDLDGVIVSNPHFAANSIGDNDFTNPFADASVTYGKISDNSIPQDALPDGAIDNFIGDGLMAGVKLANGVVTSEKLVDNAITTSTLADGVVVGPDFGAVIGSDEVITEMKFADQTLTSRTFDDSSISSIKIGTNSVSSSNLFDGVAVSAKLKDATVGEAAFAAQSVTDAKIMERAVSFGNLADGAVSSRHVQDDALSSQKIADGAVGSDAFPANSVGTDKLNPSSVTADKIRSSAVGNTEIIDAAVVGGKLGVNSTEASNLVDGAVSLQVIADGAIEDRHLRAISSSHVAESGVGTNAFATTTLESRSISPELSVGNLQLRDDSVTGFAADSITELPSGTVVGENILIDVTGKFSAESVGMGQVSAAAVSSMSLADGAVTTITVASNAVTRTTLADGAVGNGHFMDAAISGTHLGTDLSGNIFNLTADDLDDLSVTATAIQDNTVTETDFEASVIPEAFIQDNAVGNGDFASSSILDETLQSDSISAELLADLGITNRAFANLSILSISDPVIVVLSSHIGERAIGERELAPSAIAGANLASGVVVGSHLETLESSKVSLNLIPAVKYGNDFAGDNFADATVGSSDLVAGSVVENAWGFGAVHPNSIKSGIDGSKTGSIGNNLYGITTAKLATSAVANFKADSITSENVESRDITQSMLADGRTGNDAFADSAFTITKIDLSVESGVSDHTVSHHMIINGSVTEFHLADGSVGTEDIAFEAVAEAQLGLASVIGVFSALSTDNLDVVAVTGGAFSESSVTNVALDGEMTGSKFSSVSGASFADSSITADQIEDASMAVEALADEAVVTSKIAAGAVSPDHFSDTDQITGSKFAADSVKTEAIYEKSISAEPFLDGVVEVRHLEESVFNLIIRTVDELKSISAKLDIGLLDDRCLSTAPESQSRQTGKQNRGFRVLEQVQQPRSLEEHEMFCQSHGLGKATKAKSSVFGQSEASEPSFVQMGAMRSAAPAMGSPMGLALAFAVISFCFWA